MTSAPIGIRSLSKIFKFPYRNRGKFTYQLLVLLLTFCSYAALHACRKVLPVVKPRLQGNCQSDMGPCLDGFEPFDGNRRLFYFGALDMSWSAAYAFGMLFMGYSAERLGKKLFLSISLFGTMFCVVSFGLGFYFEIHSFYYYLYLQILNGIFQSGGWPTLIPIVSSWIPKKTIGTIMGIWGNHYAVGNIIGQALSAVFVSNEWGMAFMLNGVICGVVGIFVILFLPSKPMSVGIQQEGDQDLLPMEEITAEADSKESGEIIEEPLYIKVEKPVGFFHALFLPGVLEYSFALFFAKIVVYTFLFWLPYYINDIGINNYQMTPSTAAFLATLFDVGGIGGNIISGFIMDMTKRGGCLVFALQILSSISIYLFLAFANQSYGICVALLLITGFFVNSPNSLITCAISADLSNHPDLHGNKQGASTITAIVDGIGCMGAVVAPLLVNRISIFVFSLL